MSLLEFRNVIKKYADGTEEIRAVDNVSMAVDAGEFVAVMGPSGSGKSTVLHLAGGLEAVDAGSITFDGADVSQMTLAELSTLRRRDVGYTFQQLNLLPTLTAVENVALPLELDGISGRTARAEARQCLHRVGLTESLDRFPPEFSGGQNQRIAIARSLTGGRRLLLADEPTGALDTASADEIISLLAQLASEGIAVVLVTHEPRFAAWADRVVFLRDGRIVDQTPTVTEPLFAVVDDAADAIEAAR